MSTTREQMGDDALTEFLIGHAYSQMMAARDEAGQRHWCDRMTACIKRRSPERVRQMERERGLA